MRRMPKIARKYSDQQREAIAAAWIDAGIRPLRHIVALAAAGELRVAGSVDQVDAFTLPEASARDMIRKETARRTGRAASDLTAAPALDAVETLRRRLVALADHESSRLERQARTAKGLDLLRAQRLAKLVQQIQSISGPAEQRPPAPGHGPKEQRTAGAIRTGDAAGILADFRGQTATAPATTPAEREHSALDTRDGTTERVNTSAGALHNDDVHQHASAAAQRTAQRVNADNVDQDHDDPGSWARAQIARELGRS